MAIIAAIKDGSLKEVVENNNLPYLYTKVPHLLPYFTTNRLQDCEVKIIFNTIMHIVLPFQTDVSENSWPEAEDNTTPLGKIVLEGAPLVISVMQTTPMDTLRLQIMDVLNTKCANHYFLLIVLDFQRIIMLILH